LVFQQALKNVFCLVEQIKKTAKRSNKINTTSKPPSGATKTTQHQFASGSLSPATSVGDVTKATRPFDFQAKGAREAQRKHQQPWIVSSQGSRGSTCADK